MIPVYYTVEISLFFFKKIHPENEKNKLMESLFKNRQHLEF